LVVILAAAVPVAVAAFALAVVAARRRWLLASGAMDMSLQLRPAARGRGWALGVARVTSDQLLWFRVFALTLRPSRTIPRCGLEVISHRTPDGGESWAVQSGAVIVECQVNAGPLRLAMSAEALTGFLSWLESAPPGRATPGRLPRTAVDPPPRGPGGAAPDVPGRRAASPGRHGWTGRTAPSGPAGS